MIPARTRDGREALIHRTDGTFRAGKYWYPLKVFVEKEDEATWNPETPYDWSYMANGQFKSNDSNNPRDLIWIEFRVRL